MPRARADYLINVLPATAENAHIFNGKLFAVMKPSAYYINAGRGQTTDEAALIEALQQRRIAGAGLDVFQTEPLPPCSPLWALPNVFITPHLGGYTDGLRGFDHAADRGKPAALHGRPAQRDAEYRQALEPGILSLNLAG